MLVAEGRAESQTLNNDGKGFCHPRICDFSEHPELTDGILEDLTI